MGPMLQDTERCRPLSANGSIDAPQVIQIRWKVEEDDRALRANLESFERLRPYVRANTVLSLSHSSRFCYGTVC